MTMPTFLWSCLNVNLALLHRFGVLQDVFPLKQAVPLGRSFAEQPFRRIDQQAHDLSHMLRFGSHDVRKDGHTVASDLIE